MDMITDMNDYGDAGLRWQSSAILALQEATEAYLVHLFEDTWVQFSLALLRQCLINREQKPLCNSCEACDDHAAGHAACTTYSWAMGRDVNPFTSLPFLSFPLLTIAIPFSPITLTARDTLHHSRRTVSASYVQYMAYAWSWNDIHQNCLYFSQQSEVILLQH